jgi:hypothetical protein
LEHRELKDTAIEKAAQTDAAEGGVYCPERVPYKGENMPAATSLGAILAIGFVLAVLVVWIAWNQRGNGVSAKDSLSGVTFDFQQSSISTFTVFVAVLGALNLTSIVVGSDITFAVVSLFCAVLVAVAPLFHKALGETIGAFLVASVATLWASFSLLLALAQNLNQVIQMGESEPFLASLFMVIGVALFLPLMAAYASRKLAAALKSQRNVNYL